MDIREKILASNDRRFEEVEVPEWDCTVRIYTMTAGDKTRLMQSIHKAEGSLPDDHFARIVYLCACDETGTQIFTAKDIPDLQNKSGVVVQRLAQIADRVNSLNDDPEALAEKNSESAQDGLTVTE